MDADKELFEFVDTLNTKETDIWSDINALESWTKRVLYAETQQSKSKQYQQVVEEALRRQQCDALLSHHDYTELIYIASLWNNLLNTTLVSPWGVLVLKEILYPYYWSSIH